jgi:hypothetical protein
MRAQRLLLPLLLPLPLLPLTTGRSSSQARPQQPRPCTPCTPQVIGTEFYVMEFADGRIFLDPNLPQLTPQQRSHV